MYRKLISMIFSLFIISILLVTSIYAWFTPSERTTDLGGSAIGSYFGSDDGNGNSIYNCEYTYYQQMVP